MDKYFLTRHWGKVSKPFKDVELKGLGIKVSSNAGNAGNDPSFQIFEAAMGLNFEKHPEVDSLQTTIRRGMFPWHLELK